MNAVYDLSRCPVNFNFLEFLIASKTLGAKRILLDDSRGYKAKYSKEETKRRMESIVFPACELADMDCEFGSGSGMDPGYHTSAVIKAFRKCGRIAKLRSVLPVGTERFTVTLRNSKRYPERNSDQASWRKFASEIGAWVIEDFDDKPIHLHERMALYMGAEMNYMVANGPINLCFFSDAPLTAFMKNVNLAYHAEHGFPKDSQLPWFTERQKVVWTGDSYGELSGHRRLGDGDGGGQALPRGL